MLVGLYMDVHIPGAITEGLRHRGISVLTSQEDGMREASDETLLIRAAELSRLLVTQDEDFLRLAPKWQSLGQPFSGIAFARSGSSIGRLIEDLELLFSCAADDELRNQVIYVPMH
jgi:predicted nuclease of predicted toxin-antitoxin system